MKDWAMGKKKRKELCCEGGRRFNRIWQAFISQRQGKTWLANWRWFISCFSGECQPRALWTTGSVNTSSYSAGDWPQDANHGLLHPSVPSQSQSLQLCPGPQTAPGGKLTPVFITMLLPGRPVTDPDVSAVMVTTQPRRTKGVRKYTLASPVQPSIVTDTTLLSRTPWHSSSPDLVLIWAKRKTQNQFLSEEIFKFHKSNILNSRTQRGYYIHNTRKALRKEKYWIVKNERFTVWWKSEKWK